MKTVSRLTLGVLAATMYVVGASASFAADSDAAPSSGYWVDSSKHYVKNNYGECWRAGYWTPAMAVEECDPDLVKKKEEEPPKKTEMMPPPATVPMAGPEKPAFAKVTIQAETLFDFDKAVVRADGKQLLSDEVVGKMKDNPQVEVLLVTGYADRIGTASYNMKLSQRRAEAVKAYLVDQGIDANRIETAAKGRANRSNKKLVECLQPNRRVVLEIKVQKASE